MLRKKTCTNTLLCLPTLNITSLCFINDIIYKYNIKLFCFYVNILGKHRYEFCKKIVSHSHIWILVIFLKWFYYLGICPFPKTCTYIRKGIYILNIPLFYNKHNYSIIPTNMLPNINIPGNQRPVHLMTSLGAVGCNRTLVLEMEDGSLSLPSSLSLSVSA